MKHTTLTNLTRRELAQRVNTGLEITLYWHPHNNGTSIDVYDSATEETISFPVPAERALDAFYHPFAHLAEQDAAPTAFDLHEALYELPIFGEGDLQQ